MLRILFLFSLLLAFNFTFVIAQTSLDSVITNSSLDLIIEALEENHVRYSDTDNLKNQISRLKEQPKSYLSDLASELYKRKAKFNQGYVSDQTQILLKRADSYYSAGVNLQAVQFYTLADFMR